MLFSILVNKFYVRKHLKSNALLTHITRSFSLSLALKTNFVYSDLVERRKRGVELSNAYWLHKLAPQMVDKLNSGQKLNDNEIHLAKLAGLRIADGAPVAEDRQILEYFATDTDSKREYKRAIAANEREMDRMIKGESNNNPTSSSSAQSNYQDSSDVTGDGDDMDYFGDI